MYYVEIFDGGIYIIIKKVYSDRPQKYKNLTFVKLEYLKMKENINS